MHNLPLTLAEGGALWPTISLVIFLSLFIAIVIYVFVVPKSVWNKDAQIPLQDSPRASQSKENSRV